MSTSVWAWTPSGELSSIDKMIQWEPGINKVVIKLESGVMCYVNKTDTDLVAFTMALYMSQKKAYWHCHDTAENVGGYSVHKLHRVIGE